MFDVKYGLSVTQNIEAMMNKILNPFRFLPLRQALCWGIAALILVSVLFWQAGMRLTSLTQMNFAGDHLLQATARQLTAWAVFAVVLYLAGLAASSSKIRFWDVAAFNLFARIPFDVSMIIFLIPKVRSVMGLLADGSVNTALKYPITVSAIGLVSMLFFLWYIFWSYKAFAESTNLKNGKGVGIFIVCFIVTYVASIHLLRLF